MKLNEMNPYVRFARIQKRNMPKVPSAAIDHRLYCCLVGEGVFDIGGTEYKIGRGTVIYIRSGTFHHIINEASPLVFSGINFDFSRKFSDRVPPLPALPEGRFDRSLVTEPGLFEDSERFDRTIYLNAEGMFESAFSEIVNEYAESRVFSGEICSAKLRALLFSLISETGEENAMSAKALEIITYINGHFANPLSTAFLAEKFSYHPNYISSLVREATGLPLHAYIVSCRMKRARILLTSTDLSVSEIGTEVGMPDVKAFSKCFLKNVGVTPGKFRANG